jgi:hypothetical protein
MAGICLLTEVDSALVPKCVPFVEFPVVIHPKFESTTSVPRSTSTTKAKTAKNAPAKVANYSEFLIIAVLLILLVLIVLTFALALYISPRLRLWLR